MTAVWGVDVALSRLAVAFVTPRPSSIEVTTLLTATDEREGARLGLLDRQLRAAAKEWAEDHPPAVVWVEQPSGRFRAPQLVYASGVVQAALYETLRCPVWTVPSGRWKKATVGVGNATKPQVRAWVDRLGVEVDGQDEADAVAIAVAGRAMLDAGSWGASA